jgi:hypothetical protein
VADLISGHRQLIERAHARGLRIYGATLTPFEGAAYWTPEGEAKRQELNTWIRTSGAYDAVLNFAAIVQDPTRPSKTRAGYDSGDHLHLSPAGYAAMANSIDLKFFGPQKNEAGGGQHRRRRLQRPMLTLDRKSAANHPIGAHSPVGEMDTC